MSAVAEPIFKPVFGEAWDALPPVMRAHYANRPFTNDSVTVQGTLSIVTRAPMRWLSALLWRMGAIPPANEDDVRAVVHFVSEPDSAALCFDRLFYFKGRKPYRFRSRLLPLGGNEVAEATGTGICWRHAMSWEEGKVYLRHRGYALRLFGMLVPLPLTFLLGSCDAEEIPVSDDAFDMRMAITHPLWGKVYGYEGRFRLV